MSENDSKKETTQTPEVKKELSPAAKRALAEAEERRAKQKLEQEKQAKERGGRDGPEPTRYGDWEKGGIAVDF